DIDNDAKADRAIKVIDSLDNPHGIAFLGDTIYVANEKSVISAKMNPDLTADRSSVRKLFDLPGGGGHWTRTIRIYNGSIYVSVGSSCNVCVEENPQRASILKCSLEGKCEVFAGGTRNAVGFVFGKNGTLYATENSRDLLGDDLPPDEINIIKKGKDYGWPYCYGKNIEDPEYGDGKCTSREPSFIDLQAHSAPLGIAINYGDDFHEEYKGKMFVAYHGSWNREIPTGYKIVSIDIKTKEVSDFSIGWLTKDNKVLGRPVDVIFDKNGMMYVSDDNAGMIYKIFYEN
ncbi:MAG TPA: PQQ-dependent sugar dehydrogenase, partial [Candidatus Nanoarchaeia archaeon]|nr:PQQ-dependent sugar dehydrogenase [Candidatus Nanoarchaeia archaeon]